MNFFHSIELQEPGKHALAVVFFTPEGINPDGTELAVSAGDPGGMYSDCTN